MKHAPVFLLLMVLIAVPFSVNAEHSGEESVSAHTAEVTHMETTSAPHADCMVSSALSFGNRGESVECLQKNLIANGLLSIDVPTGYFGELTKQAVMKWQASKQLPETGYFGPLSMAAFSAHAEVHVVQVAHAVHQPIDVSTWPSVPTVSITAHPDAMAGWNLEIKTTNFRFAGEHASTVALPNEGHAHLMVDGKKLARVYGNWFHIPAEAALGSGNHEVLVTLNANDHSDLASGGARIEAKTIITVK